MPTIQVHHLLNLAEQSAGKAHLGELVRRLVYATLARRRPNLHFLSGATNNYSGWDGWVQIDVETNGTTNTHRSVWELSTDRKPEAKIKRDYRASLKKTLPHGWHHADVTYVAATLRSITPDRTRKIESDLKKLSNRWGHIVVLSADNFVQWIEKFHSVEAWATAEFKLGNLLFGQSLEHSWVLWSRQTLPSVSTELLAAGRNLDLIRNTLRIDAGGPASVHSESVQEAIGLIYCAVASLEESEAKLLLSNALVIDDVAHARQLVSEPVAEDSMPLTILVPPATTLNRLLLQAGHRVINAFGRKDESGTGIYLERSGIQDFANALTTSMNVPVESAEAEARAVGCSVTVWHIRKLLPLQPTLPLWTSIEKAAAVIPAVFLGGWNAVSEPDAAAIKQLSGLEADDFASQLQEFASSSTPLLENIGMERLIVAPTAAFELVARNISRRHMERLEETCKEVFSRITPEVASRWAGESTEMRVRDQGTEHSDLLLDGLAETLLRIAVLGGHLNSTGVYGTHGSSQSFVNSLISALPGLSSDPRVMASLDRQLPYLLEAAPASFMRALETLLQGDPSTLRIWFADESGIFAHSFHTGLLWGLEGLAWSADYLAQVSILLCKLAEVDPGGNISNRPFRSLCSIFLAWHPGTTAPLPMRLRVLRELVRQFPTLGWQALAHQLPGKTRTAHTNHRPDWRHLEEAYAASPTRSAVGESYTAYVELALEMARDEASRFIDLIEAFPQLSNQHRIALQHSLGEVRLERIDELQRDRIWRALHRLVARHRGFADADWALPEETLSQLEQIARHFVATNPVTKHRWLFDDQFPETGKREADFKGREVQLEQLRQDALREILKKMQWKGVHELIASCSYPHIVGSMVVQFENDDANLLRSMDAWRKGGSRSEKLALEYASAARAKANFNQWAASLNAFARDANWNEDEIANALLSFPDGIATYELVDKLGEAVQKQYWTKRYAFIRTPQGDVAAFSAAVMAFVKFGRAHDVIDQDWHQLRLIGYAKVLAVVDAFISELSNPKQALRSGTISHDIQHVFKWLRTQPEADLSDVAKREYALLPLLTSRGDSATPLALHDFHKAQPRFFVVVVCDL